MVIDRPLLSIAILRKGLMEAGRAWGRAGGVMRNWCWWVDKILMDIQKLPFYLFLIIRPDGNTAFSRIHEQYPLDLDINQLLTLGSNLNNLNTMQAEIIHPDIKNNRQDEIDLAKNSSIKSISASTFQMRFLDTISGYMFIISGSNLIEQRKLDIKLDQIYKAFVDFVIKAPFFNSTEKVDNPIFLKKCNDILYSY